MELNRKGFQVLNDEEMYRIHRDVLETLQQVGILVEDKESLDLLKKNGAKVDYDLRRAYLPYDLVKHSLDIKNGGYAFYNMQGEKAFQFGGYESTFATAGYFTSIIDKDGVEHQGTYEGALRHAKLVEVVDEMGVNVPAVQPCDITPVLQDVYMYKAALVGSSKPIHSLANSEGGAETIIEMAAEMSGGIENLESKPRIMFNLCTFSPLGIRQDGCEVIRAASKYNVPCIFSTGSMAGATAPVTLAGSLVEAFAEVIGHIVLAQCYKPGMRIGMLTATRIFDMKFAACTVATPEYPILKMASLQLAHFYNIPTVGIGIGADANTWDAQYGWEKLMNGLFSKMAGMNVINGLGTYSQLNRYSFEGTMLDLEVVRVINRICRGVEVNDFSLAAGVLEAEGVDGNFLYNMHTINNYKEEFMVPVLSDRATYLNYVERNGKNTIIDRAAKELEKAESKYNYTYGLEKEENLQKIIDSYAKNLK